MSHRYKEGVVTPGQQKQREKIEIIRFDPVAQDSFDALSSRRAELSGQQSAVLGEIDQINRNLGKMIAEGGDPLELGKKLAELHTMDDALRAGLKYLEDRAAVILRNNTWLRR